MLRSIYTEPGEHIDRVFGAARLSGMCSSGFEINLIETSAGKVLCHNTPAGVSLAHKDDSHMVTSA